jgi:hypothetical protein
MLVFASSMALARPGSRKLQPVEEARPLWVEEGGLGARVQLLRGPPTTLGAGSASPRLWLRQPRPARPLCPLGLLVRLVRPPPDPGIGILCSQPPGGVETVAPCKPLERNQAYPACRPPEADLEHAPGPLVVKGVGGVDDACHYGSSVPGIEFLRPRKDVVEPLWALAQKLCRGPPPQRRLHLAPDLQGPRRCIVLVRAAVIVTLRRLGEHDLDPGALRPRRRRLPDDRFVQEALREDNQFVPIEHAGACDLSDEPGGGPPPAQVRAQQERSGEGARLSVAMVVAEQ